MGRLQAYREGLETALASDSSGPDIDYIVFSDTIVVTTPDDSESSFLALIQRCSKLFGLMLKREISIRGAIACGSYERSAVGRSVFVAGTAIVDAYRFEVAQNWVGIMLAPSARRRVPALSEFCSMGSDADRSSREGLERLRERYSWSAFVQPWDKIPFHPSGSPSDFGLFDGFALVPSAGFAEPVALRDGLKDAAESLQWLKSLAPGPAPQFKYTAALWFILPLLQSWSGIASWVERFAEEDRRSKAGQP